MWEVGEVAGREDGGPCNVVSVGQCVEQLEGVFEETAFAVCIEQGFREGVVLA